MNSEFSKKILGDEVRDHYYHVYNQEVKEYNSAITNWEINKFIIYLLLSWISLLFL